MKIAIRLLFILISAYSVCTLADDLKRADAIDIKILLNAASGQNSAFSACLIGEAGGKVYISQFSAVHFGSIVSKGKHRVYWLPSSELAPEDKEKFLRFKAQLAQH